LKDISLNNLLEPVTREKEKMKCKTPVGMAINPRVDVLVVHYTFVKFAVMLIMR
jgi:hypothetical protein